MLAFPRPTNWKFPICIENYFFWSKLSGQNQNGISFSAKFLSRRSRLTRTTSDPSRLIRPRPVNCDRVYRKSRWRFSPGFCPFFLFEHRPEFLYRKPDQVLIHTPKEALNRIFLTGGSVFARQRDAQKSFSWQGKLVSVWKSWVMSPSLRKQNSFLLNELLGLMIVIHRIGLRIYWTDRECLSSELWGVPFSLAVNSLVIGGTWQIQKNDFTRDQKT